jgi:spermidine synthase
VLGVQVIAALLLPTAAALLSLMYGPLVVAVCLFFLPGYLFGLLSPYVITLRAAQEPGRGVGAVSGEVYFYSTLGSIVGSLLSGFVLVPVVGISRSLFLAGISTLLVGTVGQWWYARAAGRRWGWHAVTTRFLLAFFLIFAGHTMTQELIRVEYNGIPLFTKDGVYERVAVVDTSAYRSQPGRVLVLDRTLSSGVTLPAGKLLFPYTNFYRLYEVFSDRLDHALILGAGTGTWAKALHEKYPEAQVDMVDVEPLLFTLATEYFFMPDTPRIVPHAMDGRQFLRTTDTEYDLILGDMYSQLYGVPWHVSTREYYTQLHARLREGGVYIGNYIGSLQDTTPSSFWSAVRTLSDVFGEVAVYGVDSTTSTQPQNLMLVARKNSSLAPLETLAEAPDPSLRIFALHRHRYDPVLLEKHPPYTDDLAPLELYAARMSASLE